MIIMSNKNKRYGYITINDLQPNMTKLFTDRMDLDDERFPFVMGNLNDK